jgi:hydrogenase 3 maturation protease
MEKTRTLPSTWKASLRLLLNRLAVESGRTPRIAILGVGNPLRSDDAAGTLVAQRLSQQQCAADKEHLLILEAGHAPENSTGELRRFVPDLVLFLDAAEMGEEAGTVRWIAEQEIDGMSASTHSLPLSILASYLRLELGCEVALLGIQPGSNEVGETVSAEVQTAVGRVVEGLNKLICIDQGYPTCQ